MIGQNMKFTTKELVTIAVFGTFWGIVEVSLGAVIKSLHIPFSGALLACIGLIFAMIGRIFVPKFGSVLFIGFIAMFLKLFSIGNIIIGPIFGIISEALVVELTFFVMRKHQKSTFMIAGGLGVLWTIIQPFVTGLLFFGREMMAVWIKMINNGAKSLGMNHDAIWGIVIIMVIIHLLMGALTGWFSWKTGLQLRYRMGLSMTPIETNPK
jgi:hypothetical protein